MTTNRECFITETRHGHLFHLANAVFERLTADQKILWLELAKQRQELEGSADKETYHPLWTEDLEMEYGVLIDRWLKEANDS